jgi:hypothetical protein
MRIVRVLVSLRRMLMRQLRMLVAFFVVALLVVFRCRVMCLGGVFVMLGCFAMCLVCHTAPLVLGMTPASESLPPMCELTAQPDENANKSTPSTSPPFD